MCPDLSLISFERPGSRAAPRKQEIISPSDAFDERLDIVFVSKTSVLQCFRSAIYCEKC